MKFLVYIMLFISLISCEEKLHTGASAAFYNVENLFDTEDDKKVYGDEEYTPTGDKKWDEAKYRTKLANIAKVISELANGNAPTFLGVCEIENRKVLEDLINEPVLKSANYAIVHIESPDERGIDVAFLYHKTAFTVKSYAAHQPDLSSYQDKTRDILHVKGEAMNGETLHFIINHWPSRGEGTKESEPKRIAAAKTLLAIQKDIQADNPNAKIIVMGDFNDEPSNKSITRTLNVACDLDHVENDQLFNAFCKLENQDKGSYRYRSYWDMLDQIMVSRSMITDTSGIHYIPNSAGIKAEPWMIQTGKYEGFPLRSYGGNNYLGGYSDHFPVYIGFEL